MTETRAALYKTARATIACAEFKAGDCVAVQFSHHADNGTLWFDILRSQHGALRCPVVYPEHHLTNFII